MMRLLNVKTQKLQEFFGSETPRYAILSHTWGHDEVLFQDLINLDSTVKGKNGFDKIIHTCRQAKFDGLDWVWIDTCCINKTSSSELSEAINSMFQWYQSSAVCYAYLEDVPSPMSAEGPIIDIEGTLNASLGSSRWFTRGWTLQELIAPNHVVFYGTNWAFIGTRFQRRAILAKVTNIPANIMGEYPSGHHLWESYSVAQKMSWAAGRTCTRVEDIAYCLLGLFGINMPLLYGEGDRAFLRLQEEIFRSIDDHSILAWTAPDTSQRLWTPSSALAWSPSCFAVCGDIINIHEELGDASTVTKKGLQMSLPVEEESTSEIWSLYRKYSPWPVCRAALNCGYASGAKVHRVCILLVRDEATSSPRDVRSYSRLITPRHFLVDRRCDNFGSVQSIGTHKIIFLRSYRHKFSRPIHIPISNEPLHLHISGPEGLVASCTYFTFGADSPALWDADIYEWKRASCVPLSRESWPTTYSGNMPTVSSSSNCSLTFKAYLSNLGRISNVSIFCTIVRPGPGRRGSFLLEVRSDDGAVPRTAQYFGYSNVENVNGTLAEASIITNNAILSVTLLSQQTWTFPRGSVPDLPGQRLHLTLRVSLQSTTQSGQNTTVAQQSVQSWRIVQQPFAKAKHVPVHPTMNMRPLQAKRDLKKPRQSLIVEISDV